MGNGLTTEEQKTIAAVFAQVPAIERAVLFGSRAMGLARSNSDVDIALYGEKLSLPDILHTASLLEETPLPYQFDLISHASITSPDLLEHIRQYGKEMYRKESNSQEKCSSERSIAPDGRTLPNVQQTGGQSGMTSEWREVSVGELGKVVTGKTPKTAIAENYGGSIPFLTPSDNMDVKHVESTAKKLTLRGLSEVKNCLLPPRSVCVSCIGSDLGKVVITTRETVTNQQINSIIPAVGVDADFLYYAMLILGKKLNHISKTSTAVPIVNKSSFSSYTIKLPKFDEQRTIAATLSSLDDKIENNRKINQCLEQMAQAMFDRLIIEESIDEPLGVLADIAEINPPRMLKRGQNAAYVEMANLPTQGAFPNNWEIKSFTGGMKFKNGDTIFARISPCLQNGKTAYINFLNEGEVAFGSTEYIVISSKKDYCNEMFYFLARYPDFVNYAVGNMNGSSGRQRVSGNTLENYELHIPTKENVRKFAMFATPVMNIILQNSLENRNLAALRDALLPRLMSGELSVGDVEAS